MSSEGKHPSNCNCLGTPKVHCMIDAHLNTKMLNHWLEEIQKQKDEAKNTEKLNEKDILNLAIVSMMGVEEDWEGQIKKVETAVLENPLRLFPLFFYNPRCYGLHNNDSSTGNVCKSWDEPFARIVGCKDRTKGIKKLWLGFCINPALGVGPDSEFRECLPLFYAK